MKTIKQIADELGVTKQAIRNQIAKLPQSEVVRGTNGTLYIDVNGQATLRDLVQSKSANYPQSVATNFAQSEPQTLHPTLHLETVLQSENEHLKSQIALKDSQIVELNTRLAEVTSALVSSQESLKAAQALHAGTIQAQLSDGGSSGKRDGFFSRIFGGGKKSSAASENIDVD